ncbi:DUF2142 domain-containing protein [Micromonospora cremea]|uniref:DUF2142 domain-containing protein n=1 Tax=Micromonospora cremea TaxID=709881 RepID=UPI00094146B1|nr:DUF2142 domain-containing protein [Micromonospora cremea]
MAGDRAVPGLRRVWILAFVGFLLIFGAWSAAAPYDGTPDEREHVVRAAGVAAGQIAPPPAAAKKGSGAFQRVPAGLVRAQCWQFKPQRSAACAVPPGSDDTLVRTGTGAGRYHPVYYAVVGWPLTIWPGWSGVLLARLISAAISAALLAGAFVVAVKWSRRRLMVGGLLVAVTPMAAQMASAVNPNGVEIAAGAAFFAAVIPLLLDRRPRPHRGLLLLAGISGLLLAMLRQTGPLLLATAFVAFAFPWRQSNLGRLLRERAVRWWGAAIVVAVLTALAWGVAMKTSDLGTYGGNVYTYGQAAFAEADRWRGYLDQMVGVTSWLDTRMPAPAYLIWQFLAAALVVGAFVFGRLVDRWRLLVLFVGGVVVPSAMQVALVKQTGFVTQGRYMLPILAGMLLFAAYVWEERGLDAARSRTLVRLSIVLLLPIQLFTLIFTMVRWQNGLPRYLTFRTLNPFAGDWHPPLGSITPLVASVLGLVLLGGLAWWVSSRPLAETGEPASPDVVQPPAVGLR